MILDGGPTPGGIESTVLDVSTSPPRLLRPGLFTLADIEKLIGPIARQKQAANVDRPLPSPGMLSRHYAPSTPLVVVEGDGRPHVEALLAEGKRIGWLRFYAGAALSANGLETITMPTTPEAYAAQLFAVLHELDRKGLATIVVEMPPDEDVWLAVRDRLKRAAAPA